MTKNVDVVREVIEIWNDRQDIDAVLERMTDDIVWHFSAVTQPPKHGHAGAREFLEGFIARVRNPRWRIFKYAESDDAVFLEGADEFETADGTRVVIPYMGVLEFRDGKISAWRDYFDRGIADRGVEGEALPDHAAALAARPAVIGATATEAA